MSLPGRPVAARSRIWGSVGWVLLAVTIAAPLAFLANQSLSASGRGRAQVDRERHAVAYLTALAPLAGELFAAQTVAVRGGAPQPDRLNAAVARGADADRLWGDELRTHERWTALARDIQGIRGRTFGAPDKAVAAYREVVDQILGLH